MTIATRAVLVLFAAWMPLTVAAQTDEAPAGIPIESPVVVEACGVCHATDDPQILSRISYRRTTPEGWQQTIRRMVTLNDMVIDPDEARDIVRYLSNDLGLAPEEARAGAFEVERRLIEFEYEADRDTEATCSACHSMGRILNQRRTQEEWELVVAMHRGYYPFSDRQGFLENGMVGREPPAEGETPRRRHPMNRAIDHLSEVFPLHTSAWSAWAANVRSPQLAGSWAVSGRQPGRGPVFGQMTVTAVPGSDSEFTTETTLEYPREGATVAHTGRAIVYTGFQWRGSSDAAAEDAAWRQVMFVDRDWREISGRWYRGAFDEIGLDVTLTRVDDVPVITGVQPRGVRTSGREQEIRIHGANLPEMLSAADVDLGAGVDVSEVVSVTPGTATVRVTVADGAIVGARDVRIGRALGAGALVVYDQVDRITVDPPRGMARVGGVVIPKQYEYFDTVAWHDGPDGESGTADDLNLGLVEPTWSLEEYSATYGDEDLRFVGGIDQAGMFTPAVDGPNPERDGNRNNIGDVWVVAAFMPEGSDTELRARALLIVTVPLYMRFDSWEMGR
ncbi:MAG: quinohemoprotein amine dehydrogenase subunit alpha [Vicinamibacterales bacterium]|nr:quinohemoprotein amine dehydrogenase subunit alpha [Vicinamibacterales bacterium]MDP7471472.1 quinohemoprotein amine dehydrogenase subunit alpha [Vicinamibacterales bacterium]MDP7670330.1 quinohemoprotein amine dehydrogenase subunit alpha [Vicinamibacterales bacterium]HJO37987.1 quinohemoprotein amine dehydrogenase subunit alpha [Vicinamibacterales bacterium]